MKAYADYEFYANTYRGTLDKAVFNKAVLSASQYIRGATMGKSDSYDGDELRYAACEIAELQNSGADNRDGVSVYSQDGREIKSVNNAGFSVTYTTEGVDGETAEDLINRKSYAILKKWLVPTGLLNPKVNTRRCCHG